MSEMAMKWVEGLFAIGFLGLIITHYTGFSQVVRGSGLVYAQTVHGLQGQGYNIRPH